MGDNRQQELHAFTTRTASGFLDLSQEGLRYRIRTGQIKAARIGRQYFISAGEITRLLALEHNAEATQQDASAAR